MNTLKRAVVAPQIEIGPHRALGRQILWQGAPLAARAQHIHDAIEHFALIHFALAAAALGWRDQRLDEAPFLIGEVAWVTQLATVVTLAVFCSPRGRASESWPPPLNHKRFRRFKNFMNGYSGADNVIYAAAQSPLSISGFS